MFLLVLGQHIISTGYCLVEWSCSSVSTNRSSFGPDTMRLFFGFRPTMADDIIQRIVFTEEDTPLKLQWRWDSMRMYWDSMRMCCESIFFCTCFMWSWKRSMLKLLHSTRFAAMARILVIYYLDVSVPLSDCSFKSHAEIVFNVTGCCLDSYHLK